MGFFGVCDILIRREEGFYDKRASDTFFMRLGIGVCDTIVGRGFYISLIPF